MPARRVPTVMKNLAPNMWLRTRLSTRLSQMSQRPVHEYHASDGRNKNEPALKEMKKTFRILRPPEVSNDTCPNHAQGVARHCDGHHEDNQSDSRPKALLDKVTIGESQRDQRHQRTDATACLHDFEGVVRQDENVSFSQDRNSN